MHQRGLRGAFLRRQAACSGARLLPGFVHDDPARQKHYTRIIKPTLCTFKESLDRCSEQDFSMKSRRVKKRKAMCAFLGRSPERPC